MPRRDRRDELALDADLERLEAQAAVDDDVDLDGLGGPAPAEAPAAWGADDAAGFVAPPAVVELPAVRVRELDVDPATPRALWPVAKLAPGRLHEAVVAGELLDVDTGELVAARDATDGGLVAWSLAGEALEALGKAMRDAARGELLERIDRTGGAVLSAYGSARATESYGTLSKAAKAAARAELERLVADELADVAVLRNVAPLEPSVTPATLRKWIDANADRLPEERRAALLELRPVRSGRSLKVDPTDRTGAGA